MIRLPDCSLMSTSIAGDPDIEGRETSQHLRPKP